MLRRFTILCALLAAALAATATTAAAQEAASEESQQQEQPAAQPAITERGIEEIVVTARRRVENQQDVPVSVSALSGDELSFNTVQDVQDIEKSVPGIQIRTFGARTSTAAITMRGQQSGSDVATVDGAVGVYINDVYVAREKGLNQALYDVDNVQVLRGPQGTLFGRNTTGGALLINTKLPEEDFGGYVKALTGTYARYGGEGAINIPISDTLGARVAFSIVRRNGYSNRCVGVGATISGPCTGERQDIDDENGNSWRLSLLWEPTEYFSSALVHDGNIQNTNGAASFITNVNPAFLGNTFPAFPGVAAQAEIDTEQRIEDRWSASERKQRGQVKNYGMSWTNTLDLDATTAKFIFGFRHVEVLEDFDLDGTGANILYTEQIFDQDQFTAELLLNGAALDERLDWTAGIYFFQENGIDGSFSPILQSLVPFTHFDADYDHKAYSVYANAVYHLTEQWSLNAGYRYSIDERAMTARHTLFTGTPPLANPRSVSVCNLFDSSGVRLPLDGCTRDVDKTFDAHTGQLGIQWQPTDDFQAYFNARRGYRSGGFNLRAQTDAQFRPFNEEYVTDFELGFKADFELGPMPVRTNLALFYDLYDDAQRSVIRLLGANLQTVILNAADAKIKGWELEVQARPIEALELRLGSAAAVARYDEFVEDTATGPFDRSDQHFISQPDYTVNASARYTLPFDTLFGSPSGEIAVQVDWVWYDDTLLSGPQGPGLGDNEQKAYSIVDLRMDWSRFLDSPFDLSFYVKNLADKRYAVNAVNFQNSFGFDVLLYGPPRLIGGEITFRF